MKKDRFGFTLPELLVAMTVASLMGLVMVLLFNTGIYEYSRSSGRVELLRKGRNALNRLAPLIASAMKPNLSMEAIYAPAAIMVLDEATPGSTSVMFASPATPYLLETVGAFNARNPVYGLYEVAMVPGLNGANDVVLRKITETVSGTPPPPFSYAVNTAVEPYYVVKGIDNFEVKRLKNEAVQLRIDLGNARISDLTIREKTKNRAPLQVSVTTLVEVAYYTK